MSLRRLPIYIMVDCSASMRGDPIEAVKQGIRMLHADLQSEPQALESAYVSVISFDSSARQVVPLTDLMQFAPPELEAKGLTAFGDGLRLLAESIAREVRLNTPEQKGDWRPLVFILTDGEPTGPYEDGLNQLRNTQPRPNIIAVGCGAQAKADVLRQVTNNVLMMRDMSSDAFKAFFEYASQTISEVSRTCSRSGAPNGEGNGVGAVTLPPPPPRFEITP